MQFSMFAFMIVGAAAEFESKAILLPNCTYQTGYKLNLEARTYYSPPRSQEDQCTLIGVPGTKIVGGLVWGGNSLTLAGTMHIEGEISADQDLNFDGNISVDGKGKSGGAEVNSLHGNLKFVNFTLTWHPFLHTSLTGGNMQFIHSALDGIDMGFLYFRRGTTATFVDSSVNGVMSMEFTESTVSFKGKSQFEFGQGYPVGGLTFDRSTVDFQSSDHMIKFPFPSDIILNASNHSTVTLKHCKSFASAIDRPKVFTDDTSKISCIPSASEPTIV